jgi:hypothetical protein
MHEGQVYSSVRILHLTKLPLGNERERMFMSDKKSLRDFIITSLSLEEIQRKSFRLK